MYAEMEPFEPETQVLPQVNGVRRSVGPQVSPPRLTNAPARLSPDPRQTMADLLLPAELVHAKASALTQDALAGGARHSMRLWRETCNDAILSLVRAVTATPEAAPCQSLHWELDGEDYHVIATFSRINSTYH
jgi:hypothetical protein